MVDGQAQRRLRELFDLGADLPRAERDAFLDRHCADDPALRAELAAMLAQDVLGTSPLLEKGVSASVQEPDEHIGRYRLIKLLGEGGMGTVHLAEQEEPVRRRVALKTIRLGAASAAVAQAFEDERQTLALMDHPGIAKIFDGGVTEAGLPYFVMEYVPGPPLTDFCERFKLTLDRRLALFGLVCDAVQHAHQKGIVHRDLKPSNVLVGERDGEPVPKVIDFGVARALSDPEYRTLGTPLYMSPEQADPAGPAADTRTDVYALGVMLYELLAGRPPIDVESRSEAQIEVSLSALRAGDVPLPSERAPRAIARQLRGDLDRITLRAMASEPSRRYDSVSELRTDLERHERGEPVEAMPSSPAYLARKFVARHQLGVVMLALLFAALTSALLQTRAGERRALAAARAKHHEAEKSSAIAEFLNYSLFQAHPLMAGEELTVRDMLALAETDIPGLFRGRPTAEASVRHLVGKTYLLLGEDEPALAQLRAAYELLQPSQDEHRQDALLVLGDLISATRRLEGVDAAGPWVERALALMETEVDTQRPDLRDAVREAVAVARGQEATDATLDRLDELLQAIPDSEQPGQGTRILGRLLLETSGALVLRGDQRGVEALERLEAKARDVLPLEQVQFLEFLWILAGAQLLPKLEDYDEAQRLSAELDERAARVLPRGHWLRADAKRLLALSAAGLGRLAEAELLLASAEDGFAAGRARAERALSVRHAWTRLAQGLDEAQVRASWSRWKERSPDWPRSRSWWIVSRPGVPTAGVELALGVLEAAEESGATLSQRGMALYRLGRDAAALELLERADVANGAEGLADLAFRVLCLARMGRLDEARAAAAGLETRTAPPGERMALTSEVDGALR